MADAGHDRANTVLVEVVSTSFEPARVTVAPRASRWTGRSSSAEFVAPDAGPVGRTYGKA